MRDSVYGEVSLLGVNLRGSGLGADYLALYRARGGPMFSPLAIQDTFDDLLPPASRTPEPVFLEHSRGSSLVKCLLFGHSIPGSRQARRGCDANKAPH